MGVYPGAFPQSIAHLGLSLPFLSSLIPSLVRLFIHSKGIFCTRHRAKAVNKFPLPLGNLGCCGQEESEQNELKIIHRMV